MPRGTDRDWGTLRSSGAQWQPVAKVIESAAPEEDARGSGGNGKTPSPAAHRRARHGGSVAGGEWRTDKEISARKGYGPQGLGKRSFGRQLERWQAVETSDASLDDYGSLEDMPSDNKKKGNAFNQFKVNAECFGVVSTFKADLSQYSTPLNPSRVPIEVRKRAERIARDIEKTGGSLRAGADMDGVGSDGEGEQEADGDEEALFSSVPRVEDEWAADDWGEDAAYDDGWGDESKGNDGWGTAADAGAGAGGTGGAAGAIMAMLVAPAGAPTRGSDLRSKVMEKVPAWWKVRRLAGKTVPPGAEEGMACPFSRRVFGDYTQLVAHWAAALPRVDFPETADTSPEGAAMCKFRAVAAEVEWGEFSKETGLDETFSLEAPRAGSVWEQALNLIGKSKHCDGSGLENRLVIEFILAVTQMRCWRRDQKVEHREILEGMAAGLALRALVDAEG